MILISCEHALIRIDYRRRLTRIHGYVEGQYRIRERAEYFGYTLRLLNGPAYVRRVLVRAGIGRIPKHFIKCILLSLRVVYIPFAYPCRAADDRVLNTRPSLNVRPVRSGGYGAVIIRVNAEHIINSHTVIFHSARKL